MEPGVAVASPPPPDAAGPAAAKPPFGPLSPPPADKAGVLPRSPSTPVVVKPFQHQVGGHTAVVTVPGSQFVAKPIDDKHREYSFYKHAPDAIVPFIPKFLGVANVRFTPDAARPNDCRGSPAAGARGDGEAGPAVTVGPDDGVSAGAAAAAGAAPGGDNDGSPSRTLSGFVDIGDGAVSPSERRGAEAPVNPWSLTMYRKHLDKNPSQSRSAVPCILLENLAAQFRFPCIVDVKIGKRSYADDATPKKRARSEAKSARTTSASLGFRICGMQVYSQSKGRYLCQDKYYGRELTPDTVPRALEKFFALNLDHRPHSCNRGRAIVQALLARMAALRDALASVSGMRLYSSSVLMMYEGDVSAPAEDPESLVDLRVIDFANTTLESRGDPGPAKDGPDTSFLAGLERLERTLRGLIEGEGEGEGESDDSDSGGKSAESAE